MFQNYGKNISFPIPCTSMLMAMWEYPMRNNTRATDDGAVIHIDGVRIDNEGEYACYKAGETTVIIRLIVEVTPEISMAAWDENDMDDNVTVSMHKSYKVFCNASRVRLPAFLSWTINDDNYFRGLNTSQRASEKVSGTTDMFSSIVYTPSIDDLYISCSINDNQRASPWNATLYIEINSSYPNTVINDSVTYDGNTSFCCNLTQGQEHLWELRTDFGQNKDPLISTNIREQVYDINNGSDVQRCLEISVAKTNNSGIYTCFRLNEITNVFRLDVKVTPQINVTFEDNPDHNDIIVYRYKTYQLYCYVQGAYPAAIISWTINGLKAKDNVLYEVPRSSVRGYDLYDSESRLQYQPSENDCNVTCEIKGRGRSYQRSISFDIKEVITVDAEVVSIQAYRGDNVSMICSIPTTVERLKWEYEGIPLFCGLKHCNVFKNIKIKHIRHKLNLYLVNIDIKNDGKYSCYHGLEEIKIFHVKVIANLTVYLMPAFKRIYPDTIEVYEGTQYSLECIVNSTEEITSVRWQVNGVFVPEDDTSLVRDNSSEKLNQVTSVFKYTPLISHLTISCVAEDKNGTTDYKMVKVFFVLSLLKKTALWGGVTLFLLLFTAVLVFICCICWKCANRKTTETSLELLERRTNLSNVDKAAWRRSMQAFSKRSGSRYGLIRRSRILIDMARVEVDEGVDVYDKFITRSFRRSVVPHSRLCFVMQLKSGMFKDRWMGTLRQRRIKSKTGTFISTVSDNASEDKQFRWDMFVKSVIELPTTRHIASIIGVSMQNGRLYLIQEFLQVENLKTYFETNLKLLTKAGLVSKHIVRIARGVIDGMEYLTLNEFCHPALSIQKILISCDEECKLYDFCLHEDAPDKIESIISKNKPSYSNLAIETILRDEYTILSDVWSVGTALWEIFSLGEEPFKGLQQGDIKRLLERGNQLPQPPHCNRPFYHVMMDCWIDSPERPSMSTIRDSFKNAVREYIQTVDASSNQVPRQHASSSQARETHIEPPNTYNIPVDTQKDCEENIYEKMDGTLKTFSK
ncbi:Fibroblast growth factor receptor [Holothuria leucospilota]|uniref:Fibroblast growth factor receptor n=1 Tax=Holothuria leucospilota TaxID=206669 RepID=A0A9Q1H629_HOLLE|nr:Fibroblast growth factor receptor [Holothuria leucospilota]